MSPNARNADKRIANIFYVLGLVTFFTFQNLVIFADTIEIVKISPTTFHAQHNTLWSVCIGGMIAGVVILIVGYIFRAGASDEKAPTTPEA